MLTLPLFFIANHQNHALKATNITARVEKILKEERIPKHSM
jgi:hypothetical protein